MSAKGHLRKRCSRFFSPLKHKRHAEGEIPILHFPLRSIKSVQTFVSKTPKKNFDLLGDVKCPN